MTTSPTDDTPAPQPPLVTPCHGWPLRITLGFEGSGYLANQIPDSIECDAPGCYNSWNADGTPA